MSRLSHLRALDHQEVYHRSEEEQAEVQPTGAAVLWLALALSIGAIGVGMVVGAAIYRVIR
jgi:hypothetical protein